MGHTKLRAALFMSTSLFATIATPSRAQDSAVAAANPAEILVTARRIEERLQDVPASITVFNQQSLDNKNVRSIQDLAVFAPSLTINARFGAKGAQFSLRGFAQATRTAASVGVYFADVVTPRGGNGSTTAGDGAGPGMLFDLENVQVLTGPQGTLFGRNTTGGAVIIVPKRPTDRIEGYIEGSYGNFDAKRVQGVANLPITDTISTRFGFDYMDRDGFLNNVSGIGPKKYGDQNYISGRISLLIDVTPDLENYTVGSYFYAYDRGSMSRVTGCTKTPSYPIGALACLQAARAANQGFYDVEGALPHPDSKAWQGMVVNTTTLRVSDTLTVKNILSYAQIRTRYVTDILGGNYVVPAQIVIPGTTRVVNTGELEGAHLGFAEATRAPGAYNADQESLVEELRLQGNSSDGKLTFQGGLYYEHSTPRKPTGTQAPNLISCTDSDNFQCTDVFGQLVGLLGTNRSIGFLGNQRGETFFLNRAVYAQSTYSLLDNLKLTGGIRYTWDKSRARGELRAYRFISPTGQILTTPIVSCTLGAAADANCRTDATQKSKAPTWLLGVDFNPMDDMLVYAKYTRGYRQGAVSYNSPPPYQAVGPEKVDAYEIGLKKSWRGSVSGHFNIAAFYNKLQNQQLNVQISSSTNATTATTTNLNVGSSKIAGAEADASIRPFAGLTIDGNLAYLDTKITSLDAQPLPPGGLYDSITAPGKVGDRLPLVSKWHWTLTGTYQLPIADEMGKVAVSATYSHTSSFIYVASSDGEGTVGAVSLVNASLNWTSVFGKPFDVSLFGSNLAGKKYFIAVNDLRSSSGLLSKYIGEPRTYGIRLRYNFSE
jgi:iron complex outermembrane receptor protein